MPNNATRLFAFLHLLVGVSVGPLALAEEPTPAPAMAEPSSAAAAPTSATTAPSPTPLHALGFSSPDGRDSLQLHWLVQADYRDIASTLPPGGSPDTFTMGFAGFELDATLARVFGASMLVDFSQSKLTLINAYVEARVDPALVLRAGKFLDPINEERGTPRILNPWIGYGAGSLLLPSAELGVEVLGNIGDGLLNYNLAVTNGSYSGPPTDNDPDSLKDVIGRLFFHPFKQLGEPVVANLGLGLGASYGIRRGTTASPETPGILTYADVPFLVYAATAVENGSVTRVVPHLTWAAGPLAAYADYTFSEEHFGATSVQSNAFSGTLVVVVSGEEAHPFGRVVVARPLDFTQNQFGALELLAGGGWVGIGDSAFTAGLVNPALSQQQMSIAGGGFNYYPVTGVGAIFDYSHTIFSAHSGPARVDEDAFTARLEFQL